VTEELPLYFLIGGGAGFAALVGLVVALILQARRLQWERQAWFAEFEAEKAALQAEHAGALAAVNATLEAERKAASEKLALLEEAKQNLANEFHALAGEALSRNNRAFLDLAGGDFEKRRQAIDSLLRPVQTSLEKFEAQARDIEKQRVGAYSALTEQIRGLAEVQGQLRAETVALSSAMRNPQARGRWGELQLRRVVELAGMIEHCDFVEQATVGNGERTLRPDLVVRLPAGKQVVIDSKLPLDAFLAASETDDELERRRLLAEHAGRLESHISLLSRKAYWEQFENSPEFVVLFLPMETVFSAALQASPQLLEKAAQDRIILATPTTLIALLRSVHYGWRQEASAENTKLIASLGKELYSRLATFGEHLSRVGSTLTSAVKQYNSAVGSLEGSVLPSARRFRDLGIGTNGKQIPELSPIDQTTRATTTPELDPSGERTAE